MKGAIFGEDSPCSIYKQKCFLHLIQQPKYEMIMSWVNVNNLRKMISTKHNHAIYLN